MASSLHRAVTFSVGSFPLYDSSSFKASKFAAGCNMLNSRLYKQSCSFKAGERIYSYAFTQRRLVAIAATVFSTASEESDSSPAEDCIGFTLESGACSDEDVKTQELKVDLNRPRRRLQVSFTCDACGVRSQRLINPNAYARGTIFVQCAGCEVYHKLIDNLGLIEEYDFRGYRDASKEGETDTLEAPDGYNDLAAEDGLIGEA